MAISKSELVPKSANCVVLKRNSGQKIIQIPNKPVNKPMHFKKEKFLVFGEIKLKSNVQMGTVPFKIPASPAEMCCSP